MIKIDRSNYSLDQNVQKLKNANVTWSGRKRDWSWTIRIGDETFNVSKVIKPILLRMTNNHCSFCDYYPLSSDYYEPSLEHFKPKCIYHNEAYRWENLYISCNGCTKVKENKFDDLLLRPDEEDYNFERYFQIQGDGKIVPNATANEEDKERATITIELYKLNIRGTLLSERKKWISLFMKIQVSLDINHYPYRFLIDYALAAKNFDQIINEYF